MSVLALVVLGQNVGFGFRVALHPIREDSPGSGLDVTLSRPYILL